MQLKITGQLTTDPFGIPFLKHTQQINEQFDVSAITNKANYTIKQGAITIGLLVELEQNTDNTALEDVDLDIKIAYGGLVLIDKTVKLASVTDNTPEEISVGGPQLGFSGFIDLMN